MPAEQAPQEIVRFEDIARLTDREIQMILREVDTKDLAIALKGATPEMRDRIFSNVSERVTKIIKEEMEYTGPGVTGDVEENRARIVQTAQHYLQVGGPKLSEEYLSMKGKLKDRLRCISFSKLSFDEIAEVFSDNLAVVARTEGILALEEIIELIDEDLFQQGLRLVVDGVEPDLVQRMLEARIRTLLHQHETRYRMIIQGVISLQFGRDPRIIKQALQNFY